MITSQNIGGGIKTTIALMNGLAKEEYKVMLLLPKDCAYLKEFDSKIEIQFFKESPLFSILNPLKYIRLCHFIKRHYLSLPKETIFFCSDRPALMLALLVSKKSVIFYISRGWFYTNLSARFLRLFLFPKVTTFIGISDKQVNLMKMYNPKNLNIFLIQNGIQLPEKQFLTFQKSKITISTIGGICERKNQLQCIELINEFKDKFPIQLYIFGTTFTPIDEAYKLKLEHYITDNHLENLVFFKGHETNFDVIYGSSDIVVSTAVEEGFGRTLIEAMAYGIPVIASDKSGGPSNIIANGVDGILYNSTTDDLVANVIRIIEDASLRNNIIKNALIKVQNQYSEQTMVHNYSILLQNAR